MPLGTEIGLGSGDIVLDGAQRPHPQEKGHRPPIFGPCLLWSNGRPSQLLLSFCFCNTAFTSVSQAVNSSTRWRSLTVISRTTTLLLNLRSSKHCYATVSGLYERMPYIQSMQSLRAATMHIWTNCNHKYSWCLCVVTTSNIAEANSPLLYYMIGLGAYYSFTRCLPCAELYWLVAGLIYLMKP